MEGSRVIAIVGVVVGLVPIIIVIGKQLDWEKVIRWAISIIPDPILSIPNILSHTFSTGDGHVRDVFGSRARPEHVEVATSKQVDYMVYDALLDSEKILHQEDRSEQ
jgi:hypothetical protein